MAQCRSCTLEIPENSRFCPACGVPASVSGVVRDIAIQTGGAAMADRRAAWAGIFPGRPENPIRIEAAWWRSKPVYFAIIGPWTNPDRQQPAQATGPQRATQFLWTSMILTMMNAHRRFGWLSDALVPGRPLRSWDRLGGGASGGMRKAVMPILSPKPSKLGKLWGGTPVLNLVPA